MRLACSTVVLVNIGVNREDLSKAQMTYFYDDDICFTRIGYPHMLSSKNAPPGTELAMTAVKSTFAATTQAIEKFSSASKQAVNLAGESIRVPVAQAEPSVEASLIQFWPTPTKIPAIYARPGNRPL